MDWHGQVEKMREAAVTADQVGMCADRHHTNLGC